MIGRTILYAGGAALALAACAAQKSAIEVRVRPAPVAAGPRGLPLRIAEAHVQLALGNVALASESYRKALRDDPESLAALVGLASAYDQMGRHDLARRYYEVALALAPDSIELLGALAVSLERGGDVTQARAVRLEMEARKPRAAPPPAAPAGPAEPPAASPEMVAALEAGGPRLQRVSPQEVVLVTNEEPRWEPQLVSRTALSTTVRFVPLDEAGKADSARLRLLNAARRPGLAGTARALLASRGWSDIRIGDATKVRSASVILYPAARRAAAERLAAQTNFPLQRRAAGQEIVVLLGRDAVAGLRSGQTG
jgi:tetratricopeptide (TPR) repeat protein